MESVANHFWWSIATSKDSNDLVERFQSIAHHVVNKHHWPGCTSFKKCAHKPLTNRTKWLNTRSVAYTEFRKIIMHWSVRTDLLQIQGGIHTTLLEVYLVLFCEFLCKFNNYIDLCKT